MLAIQTAVTIISGILSLFRSVMRIGDGMEYKPHDCSACPPPSFEIVGGSGKNVVASPKDIPPGINHQLVGGDDQDDFNIVTINIGFSKSENIAAVGKTQGSGSDNLLPSTAS